MLYTIGHSNHPIERFITLLQRHGIETVVDVRSAPASRRFPQFNKKALDNALAGAGIDYLFLGRELGARRDEPDAYEGAVADYDRIAELPAFRQGLDRLRELAASRPVAMMCAEKEPLDCHRTLLVCRRLGDSLPDGIRHILADGTLETQGQLEQRLIELTGLAMEQVDLFAGDDATLLDRAYRQLAGDIAYRRPKQSGKR